MAFVVTAPTKATEAPQVYFTGAVALVMGVLEPTVVDALGSRIGNTNLRVDLYGDALGAAVLPKIAGDQHTTSSSTRSTSMPSSSASQ